MLVQGTIDAATMNSLDGLAVLVFGYILQAITFIPFYNPRELNCQPRRL